jgi:hypothetical protein
VDVTDHKLEQELAASTELRRKVADRAYADRLYASLCNIKWRKKGDLGEGNAWGFTWRGAGGMVAQLRNVGETYIDFYCAGNEGHVAPDIAADLDALGWPPEPDPENETV